MAIISESGQGFSLCAPDGSRVEGLRFGDPDGRKVLAIHGWLDNCESFRPLASELAELDIWAIDLPGHGHSDHRPVGARYHFVDWLTDLHWILNKLCLHHPGPWSFIGHSLGGGIGSMYAGIFPQAFRQLILIEGLGPLACEPGKVTERWRQHLMAVVSRLDVGPKGQDFDRMVKAKAQILDLPEAMCRPLVARGMRETSDGWLFRSDPRLRDPSAVRLAESQIAEVLGQIEAPVLLLTAETRSKHARIVPVLRKRISYPKSLVREELPGNHHLHISHAAAVATCIRSRLVNP